MSSKLVLTMGTSDGDKNFNYGYSKAAPTVAQVKTLAQTLITNGFFFTSPPTIARAAKIVTTTETDYDLSE